jgi:hypothetical protein
MINNNPVMMRRNPCRYESGIFGFAFNTDFLDKWEGRVMNPSNIEKIKQAMVTNAISLIISRPSTKNKTEKATIVVITDEHTDGRTSMVPSIAACFAVFPFSKCAYMFSAITIPSSTRIPTTRIIPNKDIIFMVIP